MKKVLLIGDSIRRGYDVQVAQRLASVAQVCFPKVNCALSQNVLRYLHEWAAELQLGENLDCIHWNAGLWDTLRLFGDDVMTPLAFYEDNIRRICMRIRYLFPNAKAIFATSTPVLEDQFGKDAKRLNCDIEAYNAAAVRIVTDFGFEINDLYALMKDTPREYHSDMTHFYTPEATALLTETVSSAICDAMGILLPDKMEISLQNDGPVIGI